MEVLVAELGSGVDRAVLEYMAGMLVDPSMDQDELKEALVPLLLDTGCVAEGTSARAFLYV